MNYMFQGTYDKCDHYYTIILRFIAFGYCKDKHFLLQILIFDVIELIGKKPSLKCSVRYNINCS